MATNVTNLGVEGLRSINRYFFYQLVAVILTIIAEIIVFTLIGSASSIAGAALQSAQGAGSMVLILIALLVIIEIVLLVFSVYALLSLMFGIRDLRRSQFKNSAAYAGISKWLKWLVILSVILVAIIAVVVLALIVSVATSFVGSFIGSYSGLGAGSASAGSGAQAYFSMLLIFTFLLMVVELVFGWKLSTLYKKLSSDVSQKPLNTAGNLLLASIVILFIGGLISLANGFSSAVSLYTSVGAGSTGLDLVSAIIGFVGLIVSAASLYLGWTGTSAALRKQ
jgi:hypothetical protein